MIKESFLLLVTLALSFLVQECVSTGKGTLNWTRNHATASAIQGSSISNKEMNMRFSENLADVRRYRRAPRGIREGCDPQISFNPMHGRNIVLKNNGRTAAREIEQIDQGVVYTDRILRRNEMFEVRLDKVNNRYSYNLGIGVTTHTPYERNLRDEDLHEVSGTWIHYHTHVWINKVLDKNTYGKDLDNSDIFKVGDRVGVLVTEEGILHFYFNGEDQGPAAVNIPDSV